MTDFHQGHPDALYGVPWIGVDGWRSSTVEGLVLLDLGTALPPKTRSEIQVIPGRDGFLIEERKGLDGSEREVVFLAKTERARSLLARKLPVGSSYAFVFSSDPAYQHPGFIREIHREKIRPYAHKITLTLEMHPLKQSRMLHRYALPEGETTLTNPGDAPAYPLLELRLQQPLATLSIGKQTLEMTGSPGQTLRIDSQKEEATFPDGKSANRCLKKGYFPALFPGKNRLLLSGATAQMEVRWRFYP